MFVSLFWNGIEAFNMYLMLVKVFDSHVSKFAVKAGVLAWGRLPNFLVRGRQFDIQWERLVFFEKKKVLFCFQ